MMHAKWSQFQYYFKLIAHETWLRSEMGTILILNQNRFLILISKSRFDFKIKIMIWF